MASTPSSHFEATPLGPIHRFEALDSTNEEALRALDSGSAGPGHVFVAREQTAGRGRRGRDWHSQAGAGLYLTAIWRPPTPVNAPCMTMACGLATRRALHAVGATAATIKWPNDLLLDGSKVAGILIESQGAAQRTGCVLVGIGINVAQREFPDRLTHERPVTSLHLEGLTPSMQAVESALLESLAHAWHTAAHSPQTTCDRFWQATGWQGRELEIEVGSEIWTGQATGIDCERGLITYDAAQPPRCFRLEQIRSLRPL